MYFIIFWKYDNIINWGLLLNWEYDIIILIIICIKINIFFFEDNFYYDICGDND